VTTAASHRGLEVVVAEIGKDRGYEAAFASFEKSGAGAVVIAPSLMFANDADDIVGAATVHEIPTIYPRRADILAGGLMSYGARIVDAWRSCGVQVGRVLKGAAPADLPIVRTTGLELVVNRAAAKAVDLAIPSDLLARADEVLE